MRYERAIARRSPRVAPASSAVVVHHNGPGNPRPAVPLRTEVEAAGVLYADLYDSAPVGYAILSRSGVIRHINATGAKILGRSRTGLVGWPLLPLVFPADGRKFLSYLELLFKQNTPVTTEVRLNRPDNGPILLQFVGDTTTGLTDPALIRTVFCDVADQRRTELQLSESRAELAAITASALDAIVSIDEKQRILLFNAAAEEMFVCRAVKAVDRPLAQFVPQESRAAVAAWLENIAEGNIAMGQRGALGELWGQRTDGQRFPIEASICQTEVGGQKRITLVMRDITERKRAEEKIQRLNAELERRVRDRTRRLAAANRKLEKELEERRQLQQQILHISEREQRRIGQDLHDGIGQQVTGLMLLNDVLLRRLAKVCPAEADNARRIREVLADTQVQVHQLARGLQPVPVTANGLMTALGRLAQTISKLHQIDCRFRCPGAVLLHDNLAATHLYRIAQEAMHNAIRHGRSKRIEVTLLEKNGKVRLVVQDNGRGLPAGNPAPGSGLGLQIMKSRCEAIGGSLLIGPVRPHGTRVECQVPLAPPAPESSRR